MIYLVEQPVIIRQKSISHHQAPDLMHGQRIRGKFNKGLSARKGATQRLAGNFAHHPKVARFLNLSVEPVVRLYVIDARIEQKALQCLPLGRADSIVQAIRGGDFRDQIYESVRKFNAVGEGQRLHDNSFTIGALDEIHPVHSLARSSDCQSTRPTIRLDVVSQL
ncbi:hypothetical protein [Kitasatospora herbaricolor]|uniref:hypothetical protein n=1 Tax=Kitasatospora herbaricolor TaxID=68217 RepID=UPI0036DCE387